MSNASIHRANYAPVSSRRGRLFYARNLPEHPEGSDYFCPRQQRSHLNLRLPAPTEQVIDLEAANSPLKSGKIKVRDPRKPSSRPSRLVSAPEHNPQPSRHRRNYEHRPAHSSRGPASSSASSASSSASSASRSTSSSAASTWALRSASSISALSSASSISGFSSASSFREDAADVIRRRQARHPPSDTVSRDIMPDRDTMAEDARLAISQNTTAFAGNAPLGKPIASGNGVSMSISLAEPMLFLQGFEQNDLASSKTTMLRGSLILRVSKPAKIKSINLKFRGRAITEWPEGIPPRKTEFKDVEGIMNHTWTFFNFQFPNADSHCADNVQLLKGPRTTTTEVTPGVISSSLDPLDRLVRGRADTLSTKDMKRLSLQNNQSRSFSRDDAPSTTASAKGYRNFVPGEYVYNFELPVDSRMPETIDVELGHVKYELEAVVERSGAFRANLVGTREVTFIRAPAENSLETVEPIAISRDWEDQLHYDIVISGKSFPLGSQVPIAFKLTPLAKVQCHRIKVYITENIQYFTSNKRVHRLEPTRRIQLFEKRADGPSTSAYPGSSVRITAGGGVSYDHRAAAAAGDESVERDRTNLLGNLDGEHNVGPTEMEFNVQLPSCHYMNEREKAARIHFDTTYSNIQVNHWIKIVLRLSKPDPTEAGKRRHFEISIDSPFNILSCRATQANTTLPAYAPPESSMLLVDNTVCGCPGAPRRKKTLSSLHSLHGSENAESSTSLDSAISGSAILPALPPLAHVHDNQPAVSRPMHLLRAPSFGPPSWSAEDPPPPLLTPPPRYETLVNGDPHGGLEDYFARLAEEVGENDGEVSLAARMEVPLTPGGRVNRSMDERRLWLPVGAEGS